MRHWKAKKTIPFRGWFSWSPHALLQPLQDYCLYLLPFDPKRINPNVTFVRNLGTISQAGAVPVCMECVNAKIRVSLARLTNEVAICLSKAGGGDMRAAGRSPRLWARSEPSLCDATTMPLCGGCSAPTSYRPFPPGAFPAPPLLGLHFRLLCVPVCALAAC
jgi:hypothetical protein